MNPTERRLESFFKAGPPSKAAIHSQLDGSTLVYHDIIQDGVRKLPIGEGFEPDDLLSQVVLSTRIIGSVEAALKATVGALVTESRDADAIELDRFVYAAIEYGAANLLATFIDALHTPEQVDAYLPQVIADEYEDSDILKQTEAYLKDLARTDMFRKMLAIDPTGELVFDYEYDYYSRMDMKDHPLPKEYMLAGVSLARTAFLSFGERKIAK